MAVPQEVLEQDFLDPEEQQEQEEAERARRREMLLNAIDAAEETAYGSDSDGELSRERGLSIDSYLGKNIEPGPEGRSQVVDRSVFETIQWVLPSLLRIFSGGGNVVEFDPLGPDDEQSAEQETDYLNYLVTQKNRWFDNCAIWFQDALSTKNAYCLAYIEEYRQTETERYENQSGEQISLLTSDEGVEVLQFSPHPDESQPPQPVLDQFGQPVVNPQTGMMLTQPVMLYDILIRRNAPQKKLCFRVLPPERCKVSDQTPDHTLSECPYFEYWDTPTISEIRQMGFEIDDDVAAEIDTDTEEDEARNRYSEQQDEENPIDPSMRRVKLRTVWIRHDTDGDGIAELQRVILVGKEILLHEEETRIPVSSIVPYILTHRHIGLSMTDIVLDLQRIMTAVLRQGLDNLYQSNNVRWAYTDKVNLDDLLTSAPGTNVEVDGLPAENLMAMMPPFLFPQAIAGLEYLDAVKEKRTGVNKTFSGVDENSLRQTATGISQLSTMAAQRVEQIARMFAPGIEYLFSVSHELLIKHGHKKEVIKLRGKWVEIDPSTWRTGRDMRVCVGYGAGNKDMLSARLNNIWAMQTSPAAMQARIVDPRNLFATAEAMVKASDFNTNKFFTDPATLPPPPPPPPTSDQVYEKVETQKLHSGHQLKMTEISEKARQDDNHARLEMWKLDKTAVNEVIVERVKGAERVELEHVKNDGKKPPTE
jgi:hypothetical protein